MSTLSSRRALGRLSLAAYRLTQRTWGKGFSLMAGGAFAEFGRSSVIQPPVRVAGEAGIAIGSNVWIGAGSWIQSLKTDDGVALAIGSGTSISGNVVISAAHSVRLGKKVLLARGVYISDHVHNYDDTSKAVLDQGIGRLEPVEIGDGAWLGENVVVCPGVTVGAGAVIGANAVVTTDVPAHALAVGAPARVVRRFSPSAVVAAS
jgi:acetyltransferase-like isoleucine patch superfamily enzyme